MTCAIVAGTNLATQAGAFWLLNERLTGMSKTNRKRSTAIKMRRSCLLESLIVSGVLTATALVATLNWQAQQMPVYSLNISGGGGYGYNPYHLDHDWLIVRPPNAYGLQQWSKVNGFGTVARDPSKHIHTAIYFGSGQYTVNLPVKYVAALFVLIVLLVYGVIFAGVSWLLNKPTNEGFQLAPAIPQSPKLKK